MLFKLTVGGTDQRHIDSPDPPDWRLIKVWRSWSSLVSRTSPPEWKCGLRDPNTQNCHVIISSSLTRYFRTSQNLTEPPGIFLILCVLVQFVTPAVCSIHQQNRSTPVFQSSQHTGSQIMFWFQVNHLVPSGRQLPVNHRGHAPNYT